MRDFAKVTKYKSDKDKSFHINNNIFFNIHTHLITSHKFNNINNINLEI